MSRKEAQNTFNDALIVDLNPINTPNTVLTDNLNGTIITYNGNEYTLQNDMGNFPLENCKLKPNYIPVGVREYGDILYIVSYNPIEEKVEIGSYPSPQTITSSDIDGIPTQTISSILSSLSSTTDYADIASSMQPLTMFISNGDIYTSKINPGDQYLFRLTSETRSRYETLEYFVIDEDRKSYNITDNVTSDGFPITSGSTFKYVSWKNPGWFAVQPRFVEISDFKVNVRKIIVPAYSNTALLKLNLQLSSTDKLLLNNPNTATGFKADIIITAGGSTTTQTVNLTNYLDLKNGSIVFYADSPQFNLSNVTGNSQIIVEVKPKLLVENSKTVTFNNFNKKLVFNVNQKGSVGDFKIGNSYWWYGIDKESMKLSLKFDTSGISQSSVLDSDVYLFYSIRRPDTSAQGYSYVKDVSGNNYTKRLLEDWNLIGDTIIDLPLTDYNANTGSSKKLFAEDIYIIDFMFYANASGTGDQLGTTTSKLIVASELMNGFKDARYDLITFDRWMGKYTASVKNKNFIINNVTVDNNSGTADTEAFKSENYEIWMAGNDYLNDFSTYIPETEDLSEGFTVSAGYKYNGSINYKTEIQALYGPLWTNLLQNAVLQTEATTQTNKTLGQYTGKNNTTVTDNIVASVNKVNTYKLIQDTVEKTLWNYSKRDLDVPSAEDYKMTYSAKLNASATKQLEMQTSFDAHISSDSTTKSLSSTGNSPWSPSCISKLNNLKYDCALLQVRPKITTIGSRPWSDYTRVGILQSNDNIDPGAGGHEWLSKVDGNPSSTDYGDYISCILFKTSTTYPMLVKISNINNFADWAAWVEHVECDEYSSLRGSFYKAEKTNSTATADNSFKYTVNGKLIIKTFTYCNINLFNTSAREGLISSFNTNSKNFTLSNNASDSINSIPEIILSTYIGESNINASISSQIDTLLDNVDTAINTRNNLIDSQKSALAADDIYNTTYTSSSSFYRYKEGIPSGFNKGPLLDFLNKNATVTGYIPLRAWATRSDGGNRYNVYTTLGYYTTTSL